MNALSSLSTVINQYLALDPDSHQHLQPLIGKTIVIHCLPFEQQFQCRFVTEGVCIEAGDFTTADVFLKATPAQFIRLYLDKKNRHTLFAEEVELTGNAELAQNIVNLFEQLHIDWESHAANIVGDIPVYHAGRLLKKAESWWQEMSENISHDIRDYLQEEIHWIPTRLALTDFFTEVDQVRMDVDRLEAKLIYLRQQYLPSEDMKA